MKERVVDDVIYRTIFVFGALAFFLLLFLLLWIADRVGK